VGYSLGLLKPDCLKRKIEKKVFKIIEEAELKIVIKKEIQLTKKQISIVWKTCRKEWFFEDMIKFMTSGKCIVFIVKGERAMEKLNELVGHYDPETAKENTIRHKFGKSKMQNIIHSSLNIQQFIIETILFFKVLY
jgi:nucleoside-diphosphate kinase